MDREHLSRLAKKERRKLERQLQKESFEKEKKQKTVLKWGIVIAIVIGFGLGLWWLVAISSRPLPGLLVDDLGRTHVQDISGIKYNSNPPASGSHFPLWAQRGVYTQIISDGYLIHSLEHGYIVISYNCGPKAPLQTSLEYKKGGPLTQMKLSTSAAMSPFQPNTAPPKEVSQPKEFSSQSCKDLVTSLSSFLDEFHRVVIVPRTNLDSNIALTAWRRLEKLNSFDGGKIREFISSYENKGPEHTIE